MVDLGVFFFNACGVRSRPGRHLEVSKHWLPLAVRDFLGQNCQNMSKPSTIRDLRVARYFAVGLIYGGLPATVYGFFLGASCKCNSFVGSIPVAQAI